MTINEQKQILRGHVLAFLEHQRQATIALRAINEIGLLENEGNPLPHAIQGESQLRHWTTTDSVVLFGGSLGISPAFESGEFSDVIADAQQAIQANGYIV
jgi:hypothetical protein